MRVSLAWPAVAAVRSGGSATPLAPCLGGRVARGQNFQRIPIEVIWSIRVVSVVFDYEVEHSSVKC